MTAAVETASEAAVFRHQAGMIHKVVQINVDGITQEESLIQPQPGGNCLNWVVGHLVSIYETALPVVGQEPVRGKEALKRYARGSAPVQDASEAMDLQELLTLWDEASKRFDAGLANLTAEVLDQPAPFSPGKNPNETVRTLLCAVLFHQAYHAGQLGLLRRAAGKEGAIR